MSLANECTRRVLFTEMNVHVHSPSSSASFISIGYGPVIKQRSSYVSGRDGLAASSTWWYELFLPPSDTVGGPHLTDTWPRPFVISNLLRDASCVSLSTVLNFFFFFKLETFLAFYLWPRAAQRKCDNDTAEALAVTVALTCEEFPSCCQAPTHMWVANYIHTYRLPNQRVPNDIRSAPDCQFIEN